MTVLNYMVESKPCYDSLHFNKVLPIGLSEFWKIHNWEYYIFFVPDKPNIYPDKLDEWVEESRGFAKQISACFANLDK